jgi:signal peptidase I
VHWRRILDWLGTIALALAFVLIFEAEVAKPYRIPSSSMEPTLHCAKPGAWCDGAYNDRVIVDRLLYRFESPSRNQIVVFSAPAAADKCGGDDSGKTFVKRLVGLPGDTVHEVHGRIWVNGRLLQDGYVDPSMRGTESGTWHVPPGHYFFMGDDRVHSCDSRTWGSVPRKSLIGPVMATYWPPNRLSFH